MTQEDIDDVKVDSVSQMLFDVCALVAAAKEAKTNVFQIVYVDKDGNDTTISVYGFKYHTWTVSDTFDRLAASELNDPDMAQVIAYYNGIANESEIEAGTQIKIPILQENASTGGAIYTPPAARNNYGTDILLDKDGDFALFGQDTDIITGASNLSQNISLRLATAAAKRIRLVSYGIRSTVGSTTAISGYLMASIEQTVKADPRIKSVDKISVTGEGDKIHINVEYTDINEVTGNAEVFS